MPSNPYPVRRTLWADGSDVKIIDDMGSWRGTQLVFFFGK
jgi:hypothetical protein